MQNRTTREVVVIEVETCSTCPLYDHEASTCNAHEEYASPMGPGGALPSWCPAKKGVLVILSNKLQV